MDNEDGQKTQSFTLDACRVANQLTAPNTGFLNFDCAYQFIWPTPPHKSNLHSSHLSNMFENPPSLSIVIVCLLE